MFSYWWFSRGVEYPLEMFPEFVTPEPSVKIVSTVDVSRVIDWKFIAVVVGFALVSGVIGYYFGAPSLPLDIVVDSMSDISSLHLSDYLGREELALVDAYPLEAEIQEIILPDGEVIRPGGHPINAEIDAFIGRDSRDRDLSRLHSREIDIANELRARFNL